jgi:hypothetical protein
MIAAIKSTLIHADESHPDSRKFANNILENDTR